jgi:Cysteine-rich secretory protein family
MKIICVLIGMTLATVSAMTMSAASARAEDISAMISQYRRENGLPAVKTDPKLTAVAERQAKAMASSGIMDHDVAGSFASRISGANVVAGAENIAAGTKTWADTLRIWKGSPGHNKNLLTPGADIIGVAVARNENTRYKVYWAMVIGRRDVKHRPGAVAATSAGRAGSPAGRGIDAAPDAPAADGSSVGDVVNRAITSIKSLFQ